MPSSKLAHCATSITVNSLLTHQGFTQLLEKFYFVFCFEAKDQGLAYEGKTTSKYFTTKSALTTGLSANRWKGLPDFLDIDDIDSTLRSKRSGICPKPSLPTMSIQLISVPDFEAWVVESSMIYINRREMVRARSSLTSPDWSPYSCLCS